MELRPGDVSSPAAPGHPDPSGGEGTPRQEVPEERVESETQFRLTSLQYESEEYELEGAPQDRE